jgi:Chalcone isomerase-like
MQSLLLPLLLSALLALSPSTARAALPATATEAHAGLKEVGRGRLTWLGFGIYRASLWTTTGQYDGFRAGQTVALSLWYERKFTRAQLLGITQHEWERLKLGTPDQQRRWRAELERYWADVRPGDNITTVAVAGGGTRFYTQHRLLGEVADPAFGPAFLAIWLDPRSAVAGLRREILGDDA